jgi:hypothetical protein
MGHRGAAALAGTLTMASRVKRYPLTGGFTVLIPPEMLRFGIRHVTYIRYVTGDLIIGGLVPTNVDSKTK